MDGWECKEFPEIMTSRICWVNMIVVGFDWEKGGALTFTGVHEEEKRAHRAELQEKADMDFEEWADDEDWVDEDEPKSDEQDTREPELEEEPEGEAAFS